MNIFQNLNIYYGIDNNKFEDMKIKLQQLQIAPVIADKSLSDSNILYSNKTRVQHKKVAFSS